MWLTAILTDKPLKIPNVAYASRYKALNYSAMIMRYLFYVVFLFLTISCSFQNDKTNSIEIVKNFYKGLNQSDFEIVSSCIADSFAINEKESNFIVKFSRIEYKDWFQWDSTFNPKYEIVEIEERNDSVFATISKEDRRILFINEEPSLFEAHFEIVDNKLTVLNRIKTQNVNWTEWLNKVDKLNKYIDTYEPDHSGFMNVQNKEYGEKYQNAINLYLEREVQN